MWSASTSIRRPCGRSLGRREKIQALDRTQPGLPMKPGRAGTMTHEYKRHGTTTLFAALNILDGTVIGRNMQRHRHQEFIPFLNTIEAQVPAGKAIHAVVDNYATHKHRNGWRDIHAGPSTSPRPRHLGSTRSISSLPSSPNSGSSAAYSAGLTVVRTNQERSWYRFVNPTPPTGRPQWRRIGRCVAAR
jgi:hypothetical protein